jgi:hypothetical protein
LQRDSRFELRSAFLHYKASSLEASAQGMEQYSHFFPDREKTPHGEWLE